VCFTLLTKFLYFYLVNYILCSIMHTNIDIYIHVSRIITFVWNMKTKERRCVLPYEQSSCIFWEVVTADGRKFRKELKFFSCCQQVLLAFHCMALASTEVFNFEGRYRNASYIWCQKCVWRVTKNIILNYIVVLFLLKLTFNSHLCTYPGTYEVNNSVSGKHNVMNRK
jgi:hypothetical protein